MFLVILGVGVEFEKWVRVWHWGASVHICAVRAKVFDWDFHRARNSVLWTAAKWGIRSCCSRSRTCVYVFIDILRNSGSPALIIARRPPPSGSIRTSAPHHFVPDRFRIWLFFFCVYVRYTVLLFSVILILDLRPAARTLPPKVRYRLFLPISTKPSTFPAALLPERKWNEQMFGDVNSVCLPAQREV